MLHSSFCAHSVEPVCVCWLLSLALICFVFVVFIFTNVSFLFVDIFASDTLLDSVVLDAHRYMKTLHSTPYTKINVYIYSDSSFIVEV